MRMFLATLALFKTMALLPHAAPSVDKPRITYGAFSSEVFSHPSSGGLVRKFITRVELDWLGLTSHPTAMNQIHDVNDVDTEDSLALRMMQLGGRWWPNQQLYDRHQNADYSYGDHYPPDLDIGYLATGGVLVLRTSASNSPCCDDLPGTAPCKPNTWSRLSLCATMEERCDVLREFGAVMYGSIEECPDIPASLQEGIAQGREYEGLLKQMEDMSYVDRWMNSL